MENETKLKIHKPCPRQLVQLIELGRHNTFYYFRQNGIYGASPALNSEDMEAYAGGSMPEVGKQHMPFGNNSCLANMGSQCFGTFLTCTGSTRGQGQGLCAVHL